MLVFHNKGNIMYEELADYDFNELTVLLAEAFYSDNKDHAYTIMQELTWRLENTGV